MHKFDLRGGKKYNFIKIGLKMKFFSSLYFVIFYYYDYKNLFRGVFFIFIYISYKLKSILVINQKLGKLRLILNLYLYH